MNFLIVLACVGLAAADVSHLSSEYLPPQRSSSVINYNRGSDAIISSPVVSSYSQQIRPEISYSRQVNVPTYQVIDGGYDNSVIGTGSYGNNGLVGAYDSGLSGGYQGGLSGGYQGGIIDNGYQGYQSSGGLIGGGGIVSSGLGNGLIGGGGSNILRTISAPVVSNAYESSYGTDYGSNGGYVYSRKH